MTAIESGQSPKWSRGEVISAGLIWTVTAGIGLWLAAYFRYYLKGDMDPCAYFDLARTLSQGHFLEGLSAYWSPLYSLVLAGPTALKLDPAFAARMINVLVAVTILIQFRLLARRLRPAVTTRAAYLIIECTLAFVLVGYAESKLGWADLMGVSVLLLVLRSLWAASLTSKAWPSLAFGLAGGLLYWTKSVGFIVFICVGLTVALMLRRQWREYLRRGLLMVVGWAIMVVPLLVLFSWQHGHFTISTSATYTLQYQSPAASVNFLNYPGIYPPTSEYHTSAWTDPSAYTGTWKPFESSANFGYFITKVLGDNLRDVLHELTDFGPAVTVGLALLMGLWFGRKRLGGKSVDESDRPVPAAPLQPRLIAAAAMVSVFTILITQLPTWQDSRYAWMLVPVGFLGLVWWLGWAAGPRSNSLAIALAVATFALTASAQPWPALDRDTAYTSHRITALAQIIPAGSKIMSEREWIGMYSAYYGHSQFYGVMDPAANEGFIDRMRSHGVEYLALEPGGTGGLPQDFLDQHFDRIDAALNLYSLKP